MDSLVNNVFTVIAVALTIWFWILSKRQNEAIKNNIDINSDLIKRTTDLMKVSEEIGITAAYPNRKLALRNFVEYFINQNQLVIIGSSLKGLKSQIDDFELIISHRIDKKLSSRFLLTHPCYSPLREEKEARSAGEIMQEIEEMVNLLKDWGIQDTCIRLYLGTPTNFCIITEDKMLINPYPYQLESYRSFCLEVDRKPIKDIGELLKQNSITALKNDGNSILGAMELHYKRIIDPARWNDFIKELEDQSEHNFSHNISTSIYGQYYWFHYLLPWYSKYSISAADYQTNCKDVKTCARRRSGIENCFVYRTNNVKEDVLV